MIMVVSEDDDNDGDDDANGTSFLKNFCRNQIHFHNLC